jgi:peptide-methionine (S)-S-oxide reductase
VGYAGGTKKNPTYYSLGDHSETIEIEYDPTRITYGELLDVFWASHDPASSSWSRQYASFIFYHDEGQKRVAEKSKAKIASRLGAPVVTEIVPYNGFTLAEDYHQKYVLQSYSRFKEELQRAYPLMSDFINSTAVARLNGYLGGEGTYEDLMKEIGTLGLSLARQEELKSLVARRSRSASCPVPR